MYEIFQQIWYIRGEQFSDSEVLITFSISKNAIQFLNEKGTIMWTGNLELEGNKMYTKYT